MSKLVPITEGDFVVVESRLIEGRLAVVEVVHVTPSKVRLRLVRELDEEEDDGGSLRSRKAVHFVLGRRHAQALAARKVLDEAWRVRQARETEARAAIRRDYLATVDALRPAGA